MLQRPFLFSRWTSLALSFFLQSALGDPLNILPTHPEQSRICESTLQWIGKASNTRGNMYTGALSELDQLLQKAAEGDPLLLQKIQKNSETLLQFTDFIVNYSGNNSGVLALKRAINADPNFARKHLLICVPGKSCVSQLSSFHAGESTQLRKMEYALFGGTEYPMGYSPGEVERFRNTNPSAAHFIILEPHAGPHVLIHELGHFANSLLIDDWLEANFKLPQEKQDRLFKTYTRLRSDGVREIDLGFKMTLEESLAQGSYHELLATMKNSGLIEGDIRAERENDSRGYLRHVRESYADAAHWILEKEKITESNFFQIGRAWAFQMQQSLEAARQLP